MYDVIDWVPYVFVPDPEGYVKTIDGISVSKVDFQDFQSYDDFQKKNKSAIYENEVPKEIQFLAERYHGIADEDITPPDLKIYSIDIEVHSERGFPKVKKAEHPIVLINVREFGGGVNITWGIKQYTGTDPDVHYVHCQNEMELLKKFFKWWHHNAPDVVTGWNICPNNKMNARGGFDLPYLVNRSKNLFGTKADVYKLLSPIGIVRCWDDNKTGAMYVDIAGVSVIDYLALYKWYTTENPESYKLESIARHELKLGKVDYSQYKDLKTLFHQNWNLYVEYNIHDNALIEQLDAKLGYIKLAQFLGLLCRCKMEHYMSATNLIEGLMITHYRRKVMCAPRLIGGNQEWYPAAYVKDPQIGQYDWVVDLDVASSYPTAIITLNMSPETYYGRMVEYHNGTKWIDIMNGRDDMDIVAVARMEDPVGEYVKRRQLPKFKLLKDGRTRVIDGEALDKINAAFRSGLLCMAPCGSMFTTNKKGRYAVVEKEVFFKRVEVKGTLKGVKNEAKKATDPQLKKQLQEKAKNLHALQWALKIVLNGAYGVTGVPYSRYFNLHIAEAIASCGRKAITDGQRIANRWFNDGVWKTDDVVMATLAELGVLKDVDTQEDYIAYVDTDSLFVMLGAFVDKVVGGTWKTLPQEDITKAILKISAQLEKYVNLKSYEETQKGAYNSQVKMEDFSINFKQEIVCKSALFITKKKYGYHVVNEEHVPVDKIDVKGLEIIRSETPSVFRDALKDALSMILRNAPDDDIYQLYRRFCKIARTVAVEEISENKGVKGLEKYLVNNVPISGTPYHVKAVGAYHRLLHELNLEDQYPEILDDSKNKLVYVKSNPYGVECVMYDRWVKEFERVGVEPDYEQMIEKFFTNKLQMLLAPTKKEYILTQNQSFNTFFGG